MYTDEQIDALAAKIILDNASLYDDEAIERALIFWDNASDELIAWIETPPSNDELTWISNQKEHNDDTQ